MAAIRICSLLWTLLALVWLIGALRTKRTQERAPFAQRLAYIVPVFLAFYLAFGDQVPYAWLHLQIIPRTLYTAIAGVVLTALGVALAIWARLYIGQNWSGAVTIKVDHQLIRTGPYAWVRHPIYSGFLLAMLGTALTRGELRGLIGIALLWPAFSVKRRMEESFMRKTFGQEYDSYTQSTGALIPRLRPQSLG